MNDTVPVLFSVEELWLLQSVVRHEAAQQETWKFPTASLDLNDQVAIALNRCTVHGLHEAPLQLSRGDLLVLDYCVPQGAKTAAGVPIGKTILLKTFRARAELLDGQLPSAEEPSAPSTAQIAQMLRERQPQED